MSSEKVPDVMNHSDNQWKRSTQLCKIKKKYPGFDKYYAFNWNLNQNCVSSAKGLTDIKDVDFAKKNQQLLQMFILFGERLEKEVEKKTTFYRELEEVVGKTNEKNGEIKFFVESVIGDVANIGNNQDFFKFFDHRGIPFTDITYYILLKLPQIPPIIKLAVLGHSGNSRIPNSHNERRRTYDLMFESINETGVDNTQSEELIIQRHLSGQYQQEQEDIKDKSIDDLIKEQMEFENNKRIQKNLIEEQVALIRDKQTLMGITLDALALLDPNVIWGSLVKERVENSEYMQNLELKKNGQPMKKYQPKTKKPPQIPVYLPHEQWRHITSKSEMIHVCENYTGINVIDAAASFSSSKHPISASNVFNMLFVSRSRNEFCHSLQKADKVEKYVEENPDGTIDIKFPVCSLVVEIPRHEWNTKELFVNRKFPYIQSISKDIILASLGKILNEYVIKTINNPFYYLGQDLHGFRETVTNFHHYHHHRPDANTNTNTSTTVEFFDSENSEFGNSSNVRASLNRLFNEKVKKNGENSVIQKSLAQMMKELNIDSDKIEIPIENNELSGQRKKGEADFAMYIFALWKRYVCAYTPINEMLDSNYKSTVQLYEHIIKKQGLFATTLIKSPDVVFRKLVDFASQHGFKEFLEKCRSPNSDISKCGKAMYKNGLYGERLYENAASIVYSEMDPNMSTLANWEAQGYVREAKIYKNVAVSLNRLSLQARLSAYIHTAELRYNMTFDSHGGGTGKSRALTEIKKNSIEGTVIDETSSTTKSIFSDANYIGDAIYIHQEVDLTLLKDDRNGKQQDRRRIFQEMLTSPSITFKYLDISDGQRTTIERTVDCGSAIFMASNDALRKLMSPAMLSRFHGHGFEETQAHFDNILEFSASEFLMTESDENIKEIFKKESKTIQLIVFELEKMMYLKIFPVDTCVHASSIFLLMFIMELRRKKITKAHNRDMTRSLILSRIKCEIHAILNVFFFEGGIHNKKPIHPVFFFDCCRLLFTTEEHTISSIGEQLDMYVDVNESHVYRLVRAHVFNNRDKVVFDYNTTDENNTHTQEQIKKISTSRQKELFSSLKRGRNSSDDTENTRQGQNKKGKLSESMSYDIQMVSRRDWNYISLNFGESGYRTLEQFCEALSKTSEKYIERTTEKQRKFLEKGNKIKDFKFDSSDVIKKMSAKQIELVIRKWISQDFIAHRFTHNDKDEYRPTSIDKIRKVSDVVFEQKVARFTSSRNVCIHFEWVCGEDYMSNQRPIHKPFRIVEDDDDENETDKSDTVITTNTAKSNRVRNLPNYSKNYSQEFKKVKSLKTRANKKMDIDGDDDDDDDSDHENVDNSIFFKSVRGKASSVKENWVKNVKEYIGRDAAEAAIVNVMTREFSIPGKYLFDTNEMFPFLRNVIHIKEEDIGKSGKLVISSPNFIDPGSKEILKNNLRYLTLSNANESSEWFFAMPLSTFGMMKLNEKLHIDKNFVNPIFKDLPLIDILLGKIRNGYNHVISKIKIKSEKREDEDDDDNDVSYKSSSQSPFIDKKSLPEGITSNAQYDSDYGYFMGEKLDTESNHGRDLSKIFDSSLTNPFEITENVKRLFEHLDVDFTLKEVEEFFKKNNLSSDYKKKVKKQFRHKTQDELFAELRSSRTQLNSGKNENGINLTIDDKKRLEKVIYDVMTWIKIHLKYEEIKPYKCKLVDNDFNRENFIVFNGIRDTENPKKWKVPPKYHWQYDSVKNLKHSPRTYKLLWPSPIVMQDLHRLRFHAYNSAHVYPEELLEESSKYFLLKKRNAEKLANDTESVKEGFKKGSIFIPDHNVVFDPFTKQVSIESGPYSELNSMISNGKKFTETF